MQEIKVKVIDPVGLHARPATIAVSAASKFGCDVMVQYNGRQINMKSIMAVMSLGVPTQAEITIVCNGAGEEDAIKAIEDILRGQKVIA